MLALFSLHLPPQFEASVSLSYLILNLYSSTARPTPSLPFSLLHSPSHITPLRLQLRMSPASAQDRLLRVADILADEEPDCTLSEDFAMGCVQQLPKDGSPVILCFSPRRIFGRWIGLLRRSKETKAEKEAGMRDFGGGPTCARCLSNGLNGGNSSASVSDGEGSGGDWKGSSFNVGLGCSLLYLIAASKSELSKMAELRSEMERMLKNAKEELQSKDNSLNQFHSETDLSISRSSTDAPDGTSSTSLYSVQRQRLDLSKLQTKEPNFSRESGSNDLEKCIEGIDELEAEFEAELEQLQIHLDFEDMKKNTKQQMIEAAAKDTTTSARTFSMSSGEVINPREEASEGQSGVPPMELERRLHELLAERQLDRIQELETALECAKQEIQEKDMEVSWWKETAKLLSHQVPEPSRLLLASHHD